MASITIPVGTRTSLTTSAMNSLASATYVSCGTIDLSAIDPVGVLVEVKVTPGTVSGNKQVVVFAKGSLNNTDFQSGPESGTTTTDEPNLKFLGTVPCNTNSTAQTNVFDVQAAWGGVVPPYIKIIVKNDTGAALAASGHHVYYATATGLTT